MLTLMAMDSQSLDICWDKHSSVIEISSIVFVYQEIPSNTGADLIL